MLVGWRNAVRRPGRLVTTALAFALAVLVMVIIQGFAEGLYGRYTALIRHTPADLWVGQKGVPGVVNTFSSVPSVEAAKIAALPGVRSVGSIYAVPVIAEVGIRKTPLMLYGYDLASGEGGPWSLAEGRAPAGPREIVLDEAFAGMNGLATGDRFMLLGQAFTVSGLSAETNSFMAFAAFADRQEVGRLIQASDRTSFLLVNLEPGTSRSQVQALLPSGYGVHTPEHIRGESEGMLDRVMGPPLKLLLGVAFLVGLAVVALITYSGLLERQDEYGVLRALGAPGPKLAAIVITEVAVSGIIGTVAGSLLAAALSYVLVLALPQYPIVITAAGLGQAVLAGLLMGALATVIPLRRISRMDPAAVFRV